MNVNSPIDIISLPVYIIAMDREQFRELLGRAEIRLPLLAKLTGYDKGYVTTLGKDRQVGRHIIALVEAWYLLDGPKRQELLKAIEGTR